MVSNQLGDAPANPYMSPKPISDSSTVRPGLGRPERIIVALGGILPLLLVVGAMLFWAAIALFDPLGGASGSLAKPPSLARRIEMAWLPLEIAIIACFAIGFIARWAARVKSIPHKP
jgi:hypothetical protein